MTTRTNTPVPSPLESRPSEWQDRRQMIAAAGLAMLFVALAVSEYNGMAPSWVLGLGSVFPFGFGLALLERRQWPIVGLVAVVGTLAALGIVGASASSVTIFTPVIVLVALSAIWVASRTSRFEIIATALGGSGTILLVWVTSWKLEQPMAAVATGIVWLACVATSMIELRNERSWSASSIAICASLGALMFATKYNLGDGWVQVLTGLAVGAHGLLLARADRRPRNLGLRSPHLMAFGGLIYTACAALFVGKGLGFVLMYGALGMLAVEVRRVLPSAWMTWGTALVFSAQAIALALFHPMVTGGSWGHWAAIGGLVVLQLAWVSTRVSQVWISIARASAIWLALVATTTLLGSWAVPGWILTGLWFAAGAIFWMQKERADGLGMASIGAVIAAFAKLGLYDWPELPGAPRVLFLLAGGAVLLVFALAEPQPVAEV